MRQLAEGIIESHQHRKLTTMDRILIAGGTGFVGSHLVPYLLGRGYEVKLLTRNNKNTIKDVSLHQWDIDKAFIDEEAFSGVDTIINLTGAGIGEKRWTKKRKQELLDSRVKSLNLLYRYVSENNLPIQTLISSSAVGYYGTVTTDKTFTETSNGGDDFLSDICNRWERAALQFQQTGTRVVILRKGVIMGKGGFFYHKVAPLAKLGINPAVGNGKQYVPWIDIWDLVRLYDFILQHTTLNGVFNAVSSQDETMNDLAKMSLMYFGKRKLTPNAPAFLIKLIFGEMASILLKGSRVSNKKIKEQGFQFLFDKTLSAHSG